MWMEMGAVKATGVRGLPRLHFVRLMWCCCKPGSVDFEATRAALLIKCCK